MSSRRQCPVADSFFTPEANEPDCDECSVSGDCVILLVIKPAVYTLFLAIRTCESAHGFVSGVNIKTTEAPHASCRHGSLER